MWNLSSTLKTTQIFVYCQQSHCFISSAPYINTCWKLHYWCSHLSGCKAHWFNYHHEEKLHWIN